MQKSQVISGRGRKNQFRGVLQYRGQHRRPQKDGRRRLKSPPDDDDDDVLNDVRMLLRRFSIKKIVLTQF